MGPISYFVTKHKAGKACEGTHSNLLNPFISCEENEALLIWSEGSYSQHPIFFITYKWLNKLECYITLS